MASRPTGVAPDALAEGLLRDGVELTLYGRGRSMWPVIAPGDGVVARRLDRRPRPGEIVVLRTRIGVVTHRLVGWVGEPPQLVARGDWLEADDAPLPESAVLGIVSRIVKRRVTLNLGTPLGLLAHGVLFCLARLLNGPRRRGLVRRLRATWLRWSPS